MHTERGQSAIDTDPGDTIKTGPLRHWQTQFESDIHTSAFELKTPHTTRITCFIQEYQLRICRLKTGIQRDTNRGKEIDQEGRREGGELVNLSQKGKASKNAPVHRNHSCFLWSCYLQVLQLSIMSLQDARIKQLIPYVV